LFEVIKRLRPDHTLTIDGEGGGTLNLQLVANTGLVLDELGIFTRVQAVVESLGIQTHVGSERLQVILAECTLVLTTLVGEQVVMVFPVGVLIAGTFGGFGCPL
jgi:hypothetical protein